MGKLGQSLVGSGLQTLPNIPLDRIMGFHSTDIGYAQIYLFLSISYKIHMIGYLENNPWDISLKIQPLLKL